MECPEKWEAVCNGLQNFQTLLLTPRVVTALALIRDEVRRQGFETGLRWLYGLERKERAKVTLTAKTLLARAGPLDIPEIQAVWLVVRCECAGDLLGQMFPPLSKSSPVREMGMGWTQEAALAWMLTELWERRSDHWLKLVALEWVGPFPFYGIEAAPDFC